MRGQEVCAQHGGKTPNGIAAPSWKDGRYSKYLPTRLIPRYEEARNDRELGSLTHEIHLLDVRIGELVSQLDSKEAGAWVASLNAQSAKVDATKLAGDPAKWGQEVIALQELVRAGAPDHMKWAEFVGLIDQRRKLVESERKRLVELQQILTLEQANSLIVAIAESVKRHVADRTALSAISTDIARLTGSAVLRGAG